MTLELMKDASRVVNYALRVTPQFVVSLTIVIYDCNMFIVQTTVYPEKCLRILSKNFLYHENFS